ncbi:MAG: hypothetical protein ACP5KZ_02310 [bacterium]
MDKRGLIFSVFGFWMGYLVLFTASLFADGMALVYDPKGWVLGPEERQLAMIKHEDGMETLALGVSLIETGTRKKVWLFPLPASPEKIALDVVDKHPEISGVDIYLSADRNLRKIGWFLACTQLYTIPAYLFARASERLFISPYLYEGPRKPFGMMGGPGVEVYEHIEKYGVTTELVTAKSGSALYLYLKGKGLNIKRGEVPVLDSYIGKDYCFVLCWVNPEKENWAERLPSGYRDLSVLVIFPSDKIYYPLLPTSVYGGKIIPIYITIIGYLSPSQLPVRLNKFIDIHYHLAYRWDWVVSQYFFKGKSGRFIYTVLNLNAPSRLYTDDLWMSTTLPPKKISWAEWVVERPLLIALPLHFFLSVICAIVAGVLSLKQFKNPLKLALLGMANFFSIIGLIFALAYTRTRKPQEENLLSEISLKNYGLKKGIALVLISGSAISLVLLFAWISNAFVKGSFLFEGFSPSWEDIAFFPITAFSLIGIIFLGLRLANIKEEDKETFLQLEKAGFSTWTLRPRDGGKLLFILIFTFLYVSGVWVIIHLMSGYFH